MGLFSKILKAPLKAHKKVAKTGLKHVKKSVGIGGGKGKHKKAGLRSGGAKAAMRNAKAGPRLSVSGQGNARRAIANNAKYGKK
jgi:hypothetical protein